MSIIYDALKKVEKSNPQSFGSNNKKDMRKRRSFYLIYILLAFIGFFVAKVAFDTFTERVAVETKDTKSLRSKTISATIKSEPIQEVQIPAVLENQTPEQPAAPKEKLLPSLSLSGIFLDERQPYALINNQILKEGDTISGAKVIRILLNEVDLEFEGKSIELKITR